MNRSLETVTFFVNDTLWQTISLVQTGNISPVAGDIFRIGDNKGGGTSNYDIYSTIHYDRALTKSEITKTLKPIVKIRAINSAILTL